MDGEVIIYDGKDDGELADLAQAGDLRAEEMLMRRYKETVRKKARYYYMAGADEDDIVQEGMIGLLKAIRKYDAEKEASFSTFAGICITSQMISAIRTAGRDKHRALNDSVSLSRPVGEGTGEMTIADTIAGAGSEESPEVFLVMKDLISDIMNNGDNVFSDLEMQVLTEIVKGSDYDTAAENIGRSRKSVENAVQRAKKKVLAYLIK